MNSNQLALWLGALGLAAVIGFVAAGIRLSRRIKAGRTRGQRLDRTAVAAYRRQITTESLPAARDDLSDGAPKTLDEWLAEDEQIILRAEVASDLAWWSDWELRSDERAETAADALSRSLLGYGDGITGLRADLLIEACHNDLDELIDLVNTTCAWPQEWEDELATLLDEGVTA